MDDNTFDKCSELAVRIGLNGGSSLLGSGVIFVPGHRDYALIITAAHIFDNLYSNSDLLHLYFVGCSQDPQNTEMTFVKPEVFTNLSNKNTAHLYIHSGYKRKESQYPENDAAILQIPYASWMDPLPVFQLGQQRIESPILVGFPFRKCLSQNDPSFKFDPKFVTLRGDLYCEHVKLTNQRARNLIVENVIKDNTSTNADNSKWDGLSGGGLFSNTSQGIVYNGAFVTDRIEGENSFFATDVSVFREMIQTIGFRVGLPGDITVIKEHSLNHFRGKSDAKAFQWFDKKASVYLNSLNQSLFFTDSFVNNDSLSCTEFRPLCLTYYVGKLIGSVFFSSVYGLSPVDVDNQCIPIGEELVRLIHICSENSIDLVVEEALTNSAFSIRGPFRNKSIFILNSKYHGGYTYVKMGNCRNIITDLLNEMSDDYRFRTDYSDLYHLLSNNNLAVEYDGFSIVQGDLAKAQIAILPLTEVEEIIKNSAPYDEKIRNDIEYKVQQIWEE